MHSSALERRKPLQRRTSLRSSIPKPTSKRKNGRNKPKPARVKTLKKKLWTVFSQYIRKSHADHTGYVTTCDSGERVHWTETHCGHLFHNTERNQSLGGNELWFDERNFAPQSVAGNYFNKDDASKKYTLYAVRKYGLETVEEMRRMKDRGRKFTEEELEEKYRHYKTLFECL